MTENVKFESNADGVLAHVEKTTRANLRDFCETMTEISQSTVHRITGHLADSIDFEEINPQAFKVFYGGESASYAPFYEFGTSRMTPRLTMSSAFKETQKEFEGTPWE